MANSRAEDQEQISMKSGRDVTKRKPIKTIKSGFKKYEIEIGNWRNPTPSSIGEAAEEGALLRVVGSHSEPPAKAS